LKYLFDDEYYMAHIDKDKYMARLHVFIEIEHNNKCTHYGSKLKLTHPLSIKIKHLKRDFQVKVNCV
jgi:hypothetical protein